MPPPENLVIPGSTPLVHDVPLLVDVAKPTSDAPPSKKRPNCAAATIVDPNENVSGSTIVLCWLVAFVNGSTAIRCSAAFALATRGDAKTRAPARARAHDNRLRGDGGGRSNTRPPFSERDGPRRRSVDRRFTRTGILMQARASTPID